LDLHFLANLKRLKRIAEIKCIEMPENIAPKFCHTKVKKNPKKQLLFGVN
jgi:hypothetical protein